MFVLCRSSVFRVFLEGFLTVQRERQQQAMEKAQQRRKLAEEAEARRLEEARHRAEEEAASAAREEIELREREALMARGGGVKVFIPFEPAGHFASPPRDEPPRIHRKVAKGEVPAKPSPGFKARPTPQKSNVVDEIKRIQQRRDARRLEAAAEAERRIQEKEEYGEDFYFARCISEFREAHSHLLASDESDAASTNIVNIVPASAASGTQVTVCVRKRPMNKIELADRANATGFDVVSCLTKIQQPPVVAIHTPTTTVDQSQSVKHDFFAFDGVFSELARTKDLFHTAVQPLLESAVRGESSVRATSVTCIAYGQTGSGKTFTMTGVVELALQALFDLRDRICPDAVLVLSCFEIYNSAVRCLLGGGDGSDTKCHIYEDESKARHRNAHGPLGTVSVVGLSEVHCLSSAAAIKTVAKALGNRAVGSTAVNADSSRSHAMYRVSLLLPDARVQLPEGPLASDALAEATTLLARVQFVDLAGSERGADRSDDSDKQAVREASEINRSLLALKECIRAMLRKRESADSASVHTPFRGSTMTLVLKDAFSPDPSVASRVVFIGTVAPTNKDVDHTLNTLRYADRLKQLKAGPLAPAPPDERGGKPAAPPANEKGKGKGEVSLALSRIAHPPTHPPRFDPPHCPAHLTALPSLPRPTPR